MKQSFTTDGYHFTPCCSDMDEIITSTEIMGSSASIQYLYDGMYIIHYFDTGKMDYVEILRGRFCPACGAKLKPETNLHNLPKFETADKILEAGSL